MEFKGKGLLLNVDTYEAQDKKTGVLGERFKYSFLVGDIKEKNGFISDATVETYIADHPLLNGDEKVFDPIDIVLTMRMSYSRKDGKVVQELKPTYAVVDITVKEK